MKIHDEAPITAEEIDAALKAEPIYPTAAGYAVPICGPAERAGLTIADGPEELEFIMVNLCTLFAMGMHVGFHIARTREADLVHRLMRDAGDLEPDDTPSEW